MKHYQGLNAAQVAASRQQYGANTLSPPPSIPWYKQYLSKFNDPVIKLLLIATLLSLISGYFYGSYLESIGILLAVFLATLLSFLNEYRAAKEFDVLNQVNEQDGVKVIREGITVEVPKTRVVVGDIVVLDQGDETPADGILLEAITLYINESCLNGESMPAQKQTAETQNYTGAYPPNKVYKGTTVTDGQGIMEVTAVGDATELGRTAQQATEISTEPTPLNRQLSKLSLWISRVGIILASFVFLLLLTRSWIMGEVDWSLSLKTFNTILQFFMVAVTLIVAAVPEGLPMSVTLCLAYSMRRMMANQALVRKMHACETLGAASVICTDKTGTLTQNRMKVHTLTFPSTERLYVESIAVNSTAHLDFSHPPKVQTLGNPTEGALLLWLHENGIPYQPVREQVQLLQRMVFSTERKFMASWVYSPVLDAQMIYLKGAPEVVIKRCVHIDPALQEQVAHFQARGMRTLAFACRPVSQTEQEREIASLIDQNDMVFLGFAAIADPIRADVPQAIQTCMQAGIEVKIVTGDVANTAREIARQAGFWQEDDAKYTLMTGAAFAKLSDTEAAVAVGRLKVLARARPADKLRLVRLLQQQDQVVAVTGDGTNDAPALNYAQVGLSMGSGTSVAKAAGDIILLDDSFATIVQAVKWGRSIYLNIQRFIQFQLTISAVILVLAMLGPLMGIEFPMTIIQILWINLIMDTFAALALATEPSNDEVLKAPPRKVKDFIITRRMGRHIAVQSFAFLIILIGMLYYFGHNDGGMTPYKLSFFFTAFVLIQFWNLFNARCAGSTRSALSGLHKNPWFLVIAGAIITLQVAIVHFGGEVFRTVPLSIVDWGILLLGSSCVLWVGEAIRFAARLRVAKNR